MGKIDLLLAFVPISIALALLGAGDLELFAVSAMAIIPLAAKMGEATEELAKYLGPNIGGFLNATFGNATEFIVGIIAIREGLFEIVKASLTGSIIGNLLLVFGLSALAGGVKHKTMKFNAHAAGMNGSLLVLAVIGFLIPSIFFMSSPVHAENTEALSLVVAVLLLAVYALSLIYSFVTHRELFRGGEHGKPRWSRRYAAAVLIIATIFVGVESEIFVGTLEHLSEVVGWNEVFIGAVLVALAGNAAEHMTAVAFAMKKKMDLALVTTVGSSIQIAVFIAPLLVVLSALMGTPMDMAFTIFEVLAVFSAALIVNDISKDGETNWFEGALLLAVYAILAAMFFFL